jgi:hypothetical protein
MARMHDFDWTAHRTTWNRWWARDLERPIVMTQTGGKTASPLPSWWGRQLGGVPAEVTPEEIAAAAESSVAAADFHGDDFPKFWINFGPGVLSACLGGDLHADASTTWFTPGEHAGKAIAEVAIPDRVGGRWWDRVQAVTRACTARFGTRATVGFTDLGGNLDIVAALRDSNQALLDCMDDPAEVDRLCRAVTTRWWEAYQAQCAIIEPLGRGTTPWAPIWSERRCYMLQSDFSYMISPKQFLRWVVPDLADICGRIPHGFYHLDGKGELPHLDHLLAVPGLQGVQWIPGDGNPASAEAHWWPVLKRIRAAGKLVQLYSPGSAVLRLAAELPLDGYVLATWSDVPGMSNAELATAIQREAESTRRRNHPLVAVA